MTLFDVSLETANEFYAWGWRASVAGALITAFGVGFLMWGTSVRDRDFEGSIANLHGSAATLEKEAAQTRERAANLEKEAEGLRLQVEREQIERLKLEEKLGPRKIGPELRAALIANLKAGPKGIVFLRPSAADAEPLQFATQIGSVLKDAGFDVRTWDKGTTLHLGLLGIFISVRDADTAPEYAGAIQKAFEGAGLSMGGRLQPELEQGVVVIDIGSKP